MVFIVNDDILIRGAGRLAPLATPTGSVHR